MNSLNFPLNLTFKITTLSNDFTAQDASGNTVAYVRQKMLKLMEEIQVFNDESRSELNYTIRANKWLDFSATYTFTDRMGYEIGRIVRKGWASLWKANYEILDEKQQVDLVIHEENPWAKIFDSMLGELPLVGMLSGYLFHPSYIATRPDGTQVARLKKEPSFFGRKFTIDKLSLFETGEEERLLLGLMMLILLERQRG
ncbi:MAG: hypothetical protein LLF95_11085 [Bacteroidales bacterium]|nr:hypothetical protein [Bacteroidales bacterium]